MSQAAERKTEADTVHKNLSTERNGPNRITYKYKRGQQVFKADMYVFSPEVIDRLSKIEPTYSWRKPSRLRRLLNMSRLAIFSLFA